MNLRDRMNSGLQDSGQIGSEKKLSTSDITEKSSQQTKESVMQSQSETIRRQAQEMRILSSENLILKKKLQEQSAKLVSLNEQIGKLSGADLVMKQNEELTRKNSELRKNASDAEARAEAVKASYARKEEKLQKKLARAEELEQDASRKNEIDREQGRYLVLKKECEEKYEHKVAADTVYTWGCLLYAILATVFTGVRSGRFSHDVIDAIVFIGKCFVGLGDIAWSLGGAAWSLHTHLQVPVLVVVVPAILAAVSYAAVIGLVVCFFAFIGYKFVCFYKEHFADYLSLYVAITELTVIVWFADNIFSIMKLNLVVILIVIHLVYVFLRMVATRERNGMYFV